MWASVIVFNIPLVVFEGEEFRGHRLVVLGDCGLETLASGCNAPLDFHGSELALGINGVGRGDHIVAELLNCDERVLRCFFRRALEGGELLRFCSKRECNSESMECCFLRCEAAI